MPQLPKMHADHGRNTDKITSLLSGYGVTHYFASRNKPSQAGISDT